MTTTKPPSVAARDALRAAIRRHPGADALLAGRLVSALSKADLHDIARQLGIEIDTLSTDASDASDTMPAIDQAEPADTSIEQEVQALRNAVMQNGFGALDDRLRDLIRDARKPAVTIEIPVPVSGNGTMPIVISKPTGQHATWRALFGIKGTLGQRETLLWDGAHPDTPAVNARYIWPASTALALTQIARKRNIMLYGPAGTGKTEWATQLAARTGRPFALISCDASTDGPTLVGMTVPSPDGSVTWQDGQLTRAIQTPGCVVCIDEPSVARSGALFVLQNVLANRMLFIGETGRRVKVAEGVIFVSCDNTNGTGGGGRRGYTDTHRLNEAFLDRFGVRVRFDYMPAKQEADIICSYVANCPRELADLLVTTAVTTRQCADQQQLTSGIGLRRLLSWAELLVDGIEAEDAFNAAVLNCAAEQDVETLRQQCKLAYDSATVAACFNPPAPTPDATIDPAVSNPTQAGRIAAAAFKGV